MGDVSPETTAGVGDVDLSGRTVLVTGATSSLGRRAARSLGRLGARVLVHGRDERAGEALVSDLEATAADGAAFLPADFADLASVREFAGTVRDRVDELDVLVNNAGGCCPDAGTTPDGIESTFAVNHLAAFALTGELLDRLDAADGRVVTTASEAHWQGVLELADVDRPAGGTGWHEFARAKLANVLFSRELARRLRSADSAVTANCFHPGTVPSCSMSGSSPFPVSLLSLGVDLLTSPLASPGTGDFENGVATLVSLAVSPDLDEVTGGYFVDRRQRRPSQDACDGELAAELWEVSERLTGVEYDFEALSSESKAPPQA